MTKEQLESNKEIAKMLGYKLITPAMRRIPKDWSFSYWEKTMPGKSTHVLGSENSLYFHGDWNQLMLAVKFIEEVAQSEDFKEERKKWILPLESLAIGVISIPIWYEIRLVHNAVSKFAKEYNRFKELQNQ